MTSHEPGDTERPWWGTAAAATQCEGAAPRSDWAGWEAEGRVPPSRDGNGFRTRYEDDLALLAEHGIRHHRLTIEWARLEPSPGRWDDDEVAHVRRVLGAAQAAGVSPWACLLHGSAPGWFTDDQRGWLDDKAVLAWARHVDRVAEAVGDLVAGWVPIHEPALAARLSHGDGTFPPGRRNDDDHRHARAALLAAEAEAARLLRSGPAPVAVGADSDARHEGDDLLVVSAPVDGLEGALERTAEASPDARLLVVTGDPDGPAGGATSGDDPAGDGDGDGTAPQPGGAEGERRQRRLARAVAAVAEAHAVGIPVVGAFHQPAVDGYEWHRGFDAKLGLFDRDRNRRPALEVLPHPGRGA
jgi:beta-glucosidase